MVNINKYIYIVVILCIVTTQTVTAQLNISKVFKPKSALLWEISGNGLEKPSYLFGTIHIINEQQFYLPKHLLEKFAACDQLMLEINVNDPAIREEYATYVKMPVGLQLSGLLGRSEYLAIDRFFKDSIGISINRFNSWKPFLISSIVLQKAVDGKVISYENVLADIAERKGQEILELETLQYQMELFDKISYRDQAQILLTNIMEYENMKTTYSEMVAFYLEEDAHALYRYAQKNTNEYKDFEHIMLTERNEAWVIKVDKTIQQNQTFIAVGAGHLAGKNGLIKLLRKEGYKVKPLR